MRVLFFSTKPYDREFFQEANTDYEHDLNFLETRLNAETASVAQGYPAVCLFVNDRADRDVLSKLAEGGARLIALRSAGFNHVDLEAANELGLPVVRVPAYSPYAVAEHTLALILTLNRRTHRAFNRVREGNFALEGLLGFDLNDRTAGIIGTGKIGAITARILLGFGCRVIAHDPYPNPEVEAMGVEYDTLQATLAAGDIISLHCPLTPETHHIIHTETIARMKPGVMLINTSRGALVDTPAVLEALKDGHIAYLGLDVYEEEEDLFFEDLSGRVIQDDVFARLLTFPNVLITGHQAFFTKEALENIARTTLENVSDFESGRKLKNQVDVDRIGR